jgi:hypothetical protein
MFLHRLALAMGRPVSELRRTMSFAEMLDWRTFDSLHPLPDRLPDIHHGILMSALVNITRGGDRAPAQAADFFVLRERVDEPEIENGLSEAERLQRLWQGGG